MKTQQEIAEEYGVMLKDVQSAYRSAEKIEIPRQVIDHSGGCDIATVEFTRMWFINSDDGFSYGDKQDRFNRAYAIGGTRWEAAENAIATGYRADRNNFKANVEVIEL
ncbi:hypothetical protein [Bifidobacterium tissieri]|uniref:Uncharacterized protein n=1 Tax=Bifidobacterium tissieri TaxID=1630162 RepID=A0A5M9ZVG7_9BIFI|nr:hypothetical protein [Bifidobacterium tissieri]KAA8828684.1 hypothetical protein EM849_11645 [Bifidobacterium tissieri]KAA8831627.1 hypothetical protein EMO89_02560 [Bifidobacterium tissieri]